MSTALKTSRNAVFSSLRSFFDEIEGEKQAASPMSEPGSIGGETTHPSKSVDDGLIKAQEGARFSENTKDVKDAVGQPSVENAGDPKGQMQYELQVGVKHAPTGEDPSAEDDFKGTKEDPGTTSVMKADDGEKYGEWDFKKLAAAIGNLGNEIMADLGQGKLAEKRAMSGDSTVHSRGVTQPVRPTQPIPAAAAAELAGGEADEETKQAAAAGYKLAAALGLDDGGADAQVSAMVETIIKEAQLQADHVAQYLSSFAQTVKRAADPTAMEGEDHSAPGDEASGAGAASGAEGMMGGGPPPEGAGGGQDPMEVLAQLPPEVLQQLVAAIQQGGLGGGPEGGGGAPPGMDGGMGGGPPGMGGGPPPGPGGPGGPGGDPTENLSGAMHEMGVSPEELQGAAPKVAADQRDTLLKIAKAVKDKRRSGKLGYKVASSPYDQQVRAEMRQYLAEVIGG
jgi:hypothetical protein